MKKIYFLFMIALLTPAFGFTQSLEQEFQRKLDSVFQQNQDAVGAIIHIECPERNISWTSAVGYSDKDQTSSLEEEQPVLIASNTKTYVAASILRLVEMGSFKLDNALNETLSKKTCRLFKKAGYDFDKITIKHLLSHTSGIRDYVDDAYFEFIDKNQSYQWERKDQIALSLRVGEPLFEAGEKFSYGDINYLLLTEIIEQETGKPFYTSMRELLKFRELGINHTWFEGLEPAPTGTKPLAHQYAQVFNWDSYDLNPSWDLYGGGGIASTAKETALFYQYLFEGKIIEDKDLLESMHTYVLPSEESKYCLGLFHFISTTDLFYHGGWWGSDVAYSPEANASVSMFTLEKEKRNAFALFSKELLELLAEIARDSQ